MQNNQSPYAAFQIGLGIICILIGVSGFIISIQYVLALEVMSLGFGVLFFGLANNNKDKTDRGKTFTAIGSGFYVVGVILIFYNLFFGLK